MMAWLSVKGVVIKGHEVASGRASDARFPGGTIAMQKPFFRERGLDLDQYYSGTINISIAPYRYKIKKAKCTFRNVKWSQDVPPEDFSFFDCRIIHANGEAADGLLYYPHPETKPQHFQPAGVLEVLTSHIEGLRYGMELIIELDSEQLEVIAVS
ncbi:MAG: hypothetical protein ABR577_18425 [Pyrinomonadaceae bacterium]